MQQIRVAYRVPALALLTLFCGLAVSLAYPLRRLAKGPGLRLRHAIFRVWAHGFIKIVGMRVEVVGTPPSSTFFLVTNHVSYMDIVLLGSRVDAAFVAKADLRAWPMLGAFFANADTVFINRESRRDLLRVIGLLDGKIDEGLGVLLFPEGTAGKGDEILPFKPALLQYAVSRSRPVHYATLNYSTPADFPPASDIVCWWGDAPFSPHILQLLRMPGFEARLVFGDEPVADADRKRLASRLHSAMMENFSPMDV